MVELVEVITAELNRQAEEDGAYIIDLPYDEGVRYDGRIDIKALALAVETAIANTHMARIEASIAKGARRSDRRFKP